MNEFVEGSQWPQECFELKMSILSLVTSKSPMLWVVGSSALVFLLPVGQR